MDIDRRDLLTGVAATAAAVILPALSGQAAASGVRRFRFVGGPIFSEPSPVPRTYDDLIFSFWHSDPNDRAWLIRHVPTGLLFRRVPQAHNYRSVQLVGIDSPQGAWPDAATVADVGTAAYFVAGVACMRSFTPVFLHHWRSTDGTAGWHTEDAPPPAKAALRAVAALCRAPCASAVRREKARLRSERRGLPG
jgi:hypothetical protein